MSVPVRHTDLGALLDNRDRHPLVVVETIAVGSRATAQRARRRDPLDALGLHPATREAASKYRTARLHVAAGAPMEPIGMEDSGERAKGVYGRVWGQERALECATLVRRGDSAMGYVAANRRDGVVELFLMREMTLAAIDGRMKYRKQTASILVRAAFDRLEVEYER